MSDEPEHWWKDDKVVPIPKAYVPASSWGESLLDLPTQSEEARMFLADITNIEFSFSFVVHFHQWLFGAKRYCFFDEFWAGLSVGPFFLQLTFNSSPQKTRTSRLARFFSIKVRHV